MRKTLPFNLSIHFHTYSQVQLSLLLTLPLHNTASTQRRPSATTPFSKLYLDPAPTASKQRTTKNQLKKIKDISENVLSDPQLIMEDKGVVSGEAIRNHTPEKIGK